MKKYLIALVILSLVYLIEAQDQPTAADITQPTSQEITPPTTPAPTTPVQAQGQPTQTQQPSSAATTKPSSNLFSVGQVLTPFQTADGKTIKKTDKNRYDLPAAAQMTSLFTVNSNTLAMSKTIFQNYPSGSLFFPSDGALASSFSTLVSQMSNDKMFFMFLKRLHTIVLQQAYAYIKKIYANFELTFANSTKDFLQAEETYAFGTKKVILHHFINIVDGQSRQFSQSLFSNLDANVATQVCSTLLKTDQAVDLNWLILSHDEIAQRPGADQKYIQATMQWQKKYLGLFKQYFNFFKEYTSRITTIDPQKKYLGISQLVTINQNLRQFIKNQASNPISPLFFFPSKGTIQGIMMMPKLIQNIPQNTKSIGWPAQIVQAATSGAQITNSTTGAQLSFGQAPLTVAYFKDAQGNETTSQAGATGLFMNMLSGGNLYELELLAQPDWLNNKNGILNMLCGILGDFSALLGMNILDSDTESVIKAALFSAAQAG